MRTTLVGLAMAGLVAVLAGCGAQEQSAVSVPGTSTPGPGAAAGDRPSALVGQWSVTGVGVEPGTAINLGDRSLDLFLPCGVLSGGWDARPSGLFLADAQGGSSECFQDAKTPNPAPAWLWDARGFGIDGERRVLTGADGEAVAVLAPGPRPKVPSTVADSVADAPTVPAERLAELDRAAASLPSGVQPAGPAQLLGRWDVPGSAREDGPHMDFRADGTMVGSDGCNGIGGRWAAAGGDLLTVTGPQTQIGCENIDPVAGARQAGLDGEVLVLFDGSGRLTQRLERPSGKNSDGPS